MKLSITIKTLWLIENGVIFMVRMQHLTLMDILKEPTEGQ
jgi:hypothetical protein